MGDELAYFKTIRLCSITPALSNTMAVVINRISRPSSEQSWGHAAATSTAYGHIRVASLIILSGETRE